MGLMYKSVKPVKVYYQCDNCKIGFPVIIDNFAENDDNGDSHTLFVYQCPNCGIKETLEDVRFPYIDYIEYDDFSPYKI